jgi:Putative transposase
MIHYLQSGNGCRKVTPNEIASPEAARDARQRAPRPDRPAAAWVNHWGQGHGVVLRYLGRYVCRVAITNTRIVVLDDHTVTIRFKQRKSSRWRTFRSHGHEVRRFLQHVLPKGFHKVRLTAAARGGLGSAT